MALGVVELRARLGEAERLATRASVTGAPERISVDREADADRTRAEVRGRLEADGFALLDAAVFAGDAAAASAFVERVTTHRRAPQDKVEIVEPTPNAATYASSRRAQPLHTDAGYAAVAPALVAMSCEVAAEAGGLTQLVSGRALFEHLARALGDLEELFAPDALRIEKASARLAKPLFVRRSEGRVGLSFSPFVDALEGTPLVEDAVRRILAFTADVENQIVFGLRPGDVLILDNAAVLHGRTAFAPATTRRLSRAWYHAPHPAFDHLGFLGAPVI
jgi:alpha-ketoglutarate-dependent taurine dioxygenase